MYKLLLIIFSTFYLNFCLGQEKSNWSFEINTGVPLNITTPLTIKQENEADIKLNAQYYSEPFKLPIYWVVRVAKWKNKKAWELELKHQKLYLKNPPKEVQYFSVTHGYNQLLISRAFNLNIKKVSFIYRCGLGVVIAHPENMIREKELPQGNSYFDGYNISGPAFGTSLSKQFKISRRIFFNSEIKYSLCYANVPIVDGHAIVWHSAIEFIGGIGYYFIKP